MGFAWLAIKRVHRDSLSTSRAVKSLELKRTPKLNMEEHETDNAHSDHSDTYACDEYE